MGSSTRVLWHSSHLSNNLYLAGSPEDSKDLNLYVIVGLDEEYTLVIVVIQTKYRSWNEVQSQLLTFGRCQEQLQALK